MNCAGGKFSTEVVGGSPGLRGAGMRGISPRLHLTCAGASAVSAFLCFQLRAVVERELAQHGALAALVYELGLGLVPVRLPRRYRLGRAGFGAGAVLQGSWFVGVLFPDAAQTRPLQGLFDVLGFGPGSRNGV